MKLFLLPFLGQSSPTPPCWFMRQAGRYLPEYRSLREKSGGFLNMCYTPELATEITLQPIRRFGMDAAIIFSDILVVPQGLGRPLEFRVGEGPWMEPLTEMSEMQALDIARMTEHLQPVYAALKSTRRELPESTALIGFAGAPWTLLCYMLDGNGKNDFERARAAIYEQPALVNGLMRILSEAVAVHLIEQINAGADAVQLFDSWAAHVPFTHRDALLMQPANYIFARIKKVHPTVPVICFPRGIGAEDLRTYVGVVAPDGISVDQFTNIETLAPTLPPNLVLQGNMDPLALVHDIDSVVASVARLKQSLKKRPYVVNLGHGVLPSTPIDHMTRLIESIRNIGTA
jgi:uroporphyrinogen decarboxylase